MSIQGEKQIYLNVYDLVNDSSCRIDSGFCIYQNQTLMSLILMGLKGLLLGVA
jgi:hypothetical protein